MCVHPMLCQGLCPECQDDAERKKRREEGTRKMLATKAAKNAKSDYDNAPTDPHHGGKIWTP